MSSNKNLHTLNLLNPTHIVRDLDSFVENHINSLCGIHDSTHNYLTMNEAMGWPISHSQEVYMDKEDRDRYMRNLCPDCVAHPDYALLLLAGC